MCKKKNNYLEELEDYLFGDDEDFSIEPDDDFELPYESAMEP